MSVKVSVATRLRHDENANDDFFFKFTGVSRSNEFQQSLSFGEVTSDHAQSINQYSFITIRYDTRCYFNVRSKADMSQLNLPHGTDN